MDPASYRMSLNSRRSENDRIIFYADDNDSYHHHHQQPLSDFRQQLVCHGLYPSSPHSRTTRSNSVCLQSERPRRLRNSFNSAATSRRNSVHSSRSRTISYARPTPLGDGRRASVTKKSPSRRPSSAGSHRKDSVRPTKADDPGKIVEKTPMELEEARRHRKIVMIVLGTFVFLMMASILAVVITLTHSSFHTPAIGDKELAENRAQHNRAGNVTFRKENEELLNSLSRDTSVPENSTAPP